MKKFDLGQTLSIFANLGVIASIQLPSGRRSSLLRPFSRVCAALSAERRRCDLWREVSPETACPGNRGGRNRASIALAECLRRAANRNHQARDARLRGRSEWATSESLTQNLCHLLQPMAHTSVAAWRRARHEAGASSVTRTNCRSSGRPRASSLLSSLGCMSFRDPHGA
jgi:hypothetical protein